MIVALREWRQGREGRKILRVPPLTGPPFFLKEKLTGKFKKVYKLSYRADTMDSRFLMGCLTDMAGTTKLVG